MGNFIQLLGQPAFPPRSCRVCCPLYEWKLPCYVPCQFLCNHPTLKRGRTCHRRADTPHWRALGRFGLYHNQVQNDSYLNVHGIRDMLTRSSNFVQIVSSLFLLRSNQLKVLQTNLVGGILSSILLILGLSIFLGGVNRVEQQFNLTVAHLSANLLSLAATSLLIPHGFPSSSSDFRRAHFTTIARGCVHPACCIRSVHAVRILLLNSGTVG